MRIQDIPLARRPREKAWREGIETLSDEELLALLIGQGTHGFSALDMAAYLLNSFGSIEDVFLQPYASYLTVKGLSKIKALELLAVGEMWKRRAKESLNKEGPITSERIFESFAPSLGKDPDEKLVLLFFRGPNRYLGERVLLKGNESSLEFDNKTILREVLSAKVSSFVLLHNHPSGNPLPSRGEVWMTQNLKEAAEELSLHLLDHLIISYGSYYSFKDNQCLS